MLAVLKRLFTQIAELSLAGQAIALIICSLVTLLMISNSAIKNSLQRADTLEKWLFKRCSRSSLQRVHRSVCWIVPSFFKQNWIVHDEQTNAVNSVTQSIELAEFPFFSIIVGPSGSGKTRTISRIVQQLALNNKNQKLSLSFYYYDLSEPQDQQKVASQIGCNAHADGVVFIDNFHFAEAKLIWLLTQYFSMHHLAERYYVLLCQSIDRWRVNPGDHIKLIEIAKEHNRFNELSGLSKDNAEKFARENSLTNHIEKVSRDHKQYVISAAQAAVLSSLSSAPIKNSDVRVPLLRLLNSNRSQNEEIDQNLIIRLAITLSLSLHRGSFTLKDFIKITWIFSNESNLIQRLYFVSCSLWWLRKMRLLGIFPILTTSSKRYLLHEQMAEEWKDRLTHICEVREVFIMALEKAVDIQINQDWLQEDTKWLLAVEIKDSKYIEDFSDLALAVTNVNRMIKCIERNWKVFEEPTKCRLQYAILLDKVGRFEDARKILDTLSTKFSITDETYAQIAFAKIEAEHGSESEFLIKQLNASSDPKIKLTSEYWRIHISAHRGAFDPRGLKGLLDGLQALIVQTGKTPGYSEVYLISRIIFDGCRQSYLYGDQVTETVSSFLSHQLIEFLIAFDSQYYALLELYGRAHWLAHELLFRFAILGEDISTIDCPETLSQNILKSNSIAQLAGITRDHYRIAQEKFKAVGGREARYLEADLLNADIVCGDMDSENIERRLERYQSSIEQTGFTELFSYPYFYRMKWNVLLFFESLLEGAIERADHHLNQAVIACQHIERFDKAHDNQYGLWRSQLFKTLLSIFGGKNKFEIKNIMGELTLLRESATNRDYHRDTILIGWLQKSPEPLSLSAIHRFFKFYPFVHQ